MGQVFDKLKAKGLLKPLDPRPIPNPLPSGFDMNKRCSYHQVPGHDTDRCFALPHAIQDLIDNKVIAPPTRPSITNNPLPNHNFGRGPRVKCLMTKEDNKKNPSDRIYDLPKCFMMMWEELMIEQLLLSQNMTYGIKYQNKKTTKHQQMGGDTSNPKRTTKHPQMGEETSNPKKTTKHLQMEGDTSNPETLIPKKTTKHPRMRGDTTNLETLIPMI